MKPEAETGGHDQTQKRAGALREQGWAVRGKGRGIDREKALNPVLATLCAFTVCSKGFRHNNLHNPATFQNQRGELEWQILVLNSSEETEVEKEEGGEREKMWGCPVGEGKSSSWNEKQHESLLAVSHEILPSWNFYSTKLVLALEVLSRRDLHYEHGPMKE